MTAAGFRLARVAPRLGRYLVPEDKLEGAQRVLVIGYHVWQNQFAADPAVIGRDVRLGGVVHTIVGVMPDGVAFPESHRYWTALRARPSAYKRGEGPAIFIAGRLAPDVTMQKAQTELTAIGQRTAAAFPETNAQLQPLVMRYTHTLTDLQGTTRWRIVRMNLMTSLLLV